jgi:hypothetical protein
MFKPDGANSAVNPTTLQTASVEPGTSRLQGWAEGMSEQWKGLDQEIQRISTGRDLTPQELLSLQHRVLTASVSVELTSKSAGIVERDIQTLIQRS